MNRRTFDPGPLADVELLPSGERWALVFVRELRHPPEEVWSALTDPAQVAAWSPFTPDRDLSAVGDATLTMLDGGEAQDFQASVRRADRPTLLEYTWGTDVLRWELAATDGGTRLTLQHTLDDREWAPRTAAGWHLCLVVAEHLLGGDPIGPIIGDNARNYGWDELHEAYAEKLGEVPARPAAPLPSPPPPT